MKAVTITDIEKAELREYPMPTVGENDVLIQIKACALCTMEQRIYLGKKDVGGYPVIAGLYSVGIPWDCVKQNRRGRDASLSLRARV